MNGTSPSPEMTINVAAAIAFHGLNSDQCSTGA